MIVKDDKGKYERFNTGGYPSDVDEDYATGKLITIVMLFCGLVIFACAYMILHNEKQETLQIKEQIEQARQSDLKIRQEILQIKRDNLNIQASNQMLIFGREGIERYKLSNDSVVQGIYWGDGFYSVNAVNIKDKIDEHDRHEYCHYLVDDRTEHFCGVI